eukprot:1236752-Prymnesium_polylepis.2
MRSECHKYAPELSGAPVSPDNLSSSSPAVKLSLFPTGGAPHASPPAWVENSCSFGSDVRHAFRRILCCQQQIAAATER